MKIQPLILSLLVAFVCPLTKMDNWTHEWTDYDRKTYEHAKIRCGELYPDAPCVKMFRKKDSLTYNVICGI